MQAMASQYAVVVHGREGTAYHVPRHRKWHSTLDDARAEALRMDRLRSGTAQAACPVVVVGPGNRIHPVH